MMTILGFVEKIDPNLIVAMAIMFGGILIFSCLRNCLQACCSRSPKRKRFTVQHVYHGSWQSKIYPQEKGTIEITFETVKGGDSDEDEDDITAEVSLAYEKDSMYRPNQTFTFACELVYNADDKHYYLRQCNFGDGQYFTLSFSKRLNKSQLGYLTSISPHDLATISFDKEKCS